jgi:hypothetical protein
MSALLSETRQTLKPEITTQTVWEFETVTTEEKGDALLNITSMIFTY